MLTVGVRAEAATYTYDTLIWPDEKVQAVPVPFGSEVGQSSPA